MGNIFREFGVEVRRSIIETIIGNLSGEWKILILCASLLIVAVIFSYSQKRIGLVLTLSAIFVVINATQLLISEEAALIFQFLPFIIGVAFAGITIGVIEKDKVYFASLFVVMLSNAIMLPIKMALESNSGIALDVFFASLIVALVLHSIIIGSLAWVYRKIIS